MVPHNIYRCAGDDNWVAIAARDDRDWLAICDAMGRDDWKRDPSLQTAQGRRRSQDSLDRAIEQWTADARVGEKLTAEYQLDVIAKKDRKSTENRQRYEDNDYSNDERRWGYKLVPDKLVRFLDGVLFGSTLAVTLYGTVERLALGVAGHVDSVSPVGFSCHWFPPF